MTRPTRNGAARKLQLSASRPRPQKAKRGGPPAPPRNDNRDPFRWKLMIKRRGICSLSANGQTLGHIQHQINTFSKAHVSAIRMITDASGGWIKMDVEGDVDEFVLERIAALGTQIK